jgi:hypothetical protein
MKEMLEDNRLLESNPSNAGQTCPRNYAFRNGL